MLIWFEIHFQAFFKRVERRLLSEIFFLKIFSRKVELILRFFIRRSKWRWWKQINRKCWCQISLRHYYKKPKWWRQRSSDFHYYYYFGSDCCYTPDTHNVSSHLLLQKVSIFFYKNFFFYLVRKSRRLFWKLVYWLHF